MKENKKIWNGYPVIGSTKELDFIVKSEGHINLDKNDIISTLSTEGNNYVASGIAATLGNAFESAVENLNVTLKVAKRMLVQFVCGSQQVDMADLRPVTELLNEASTEMSLLWGIAYDHTLNDNFKVIILMSK